MIDHETRVLRPRGEFTEADAHALVAAAERLDRGAAVVVDLGAATDVQDHELAILAHGLARCGVRAELRGVSRHHARVLRYLGLDAALGVPRAAAGEAGVPT
jgi:anti-anti-sigma regulatory factor